MTESGLAIFVLLAFAVPIPTLSVLRKEADGAWVILRDANIVGSERQPVDG